MGMVCEKADALHLRSALLLNEARAMRKRIRKSEWREKTKGLSKLEIAKLRIYDPTKFTADNRRD